MDNDVLIIHFNDVYNIEQTTSKSYLIYNIQIFTYIFWRVFLRGKGTLCTSLSSIHHVCKYSLCSVEYLRPVCIVRIRPCARVVKESRYSLSILFKLGCPYRASVSITYSFTVSVEQHNISRHIIYLVHVIKVLAMPWLRNINNINPWLHMASKGMGECSWLSSRYVWTHDRIDWTERSVDYTVETLALYSIY